MLYIWQLLIRRMALHGRHWMGHISPCLSQGSVKSLFSYCKSTISGAVGSLQSGGEFTGWRPMTVGSSLMAECGSGS